MGGRGVNEHNNVWQPNQRMWPMLWDSFKNRKTREKKGCGGEKPNKNENTIEKERRVAEMAWLLF